MKARYILNVIIYKCNCNSKYSSKVSKDNEDSMLNISGENEYKIYISNRKFEFLLF